MPHANSQLVIFLRKATASTETVPPAFLEFYPLVKTPSTEETPAVYYDETDALSIVDAAKIAAEQHANLFANFWQYDGEGKPERAEEDQSDYLAVTLPDVSGALIVAFVAQFSAVAAAEPGELNVNLAIQSLDTWSRFTSTGELPA